MKMEKIKSDLKNIGHNWKIVAIMTIFEFFIIIPVFNLVSLIFIFKILDSFQSVNKTIQSEDLRLYISRFKAVTILRFIASLVLIPMIVFMNVDIDFGLPLLFGSYIIYFLIILVIRIVAGIIERKAWEAFTQFVIMKQKEYPFLYITQDATINLDKAALCEILSFLFIPMFIGWIFRLIGYFKLAKLEDTTTYGGLKPTVSSYTSAPSQSPEQTPEKVSYCPFCGEKLSNDAKFCPNCGTKLS